MCPERLDCGIVIKTTLYGQGAIDDMKPSRLGERHIKPLSNGGRGGMQKAVKKRVIYPKGVAPAPGTDVECRREIRSTILYEHPLSSCDAARGVVRSADAE